MPLDEKDGATDEMNTEVLVVGGGKMGHFESRELSGEAIMLIVLGRHGYLPAASRASVRFISSASMRVTRRVFSSSSRVRS